MSDDVRMRVYLSRLPAQERAVLEMSWRTGLSIEQVCALTWGDLTGLERLVASRSAPSRD